jgi:hypothetical protein
MTRARDMADIVSGNFAVPSGSLTNVQAFPTNWTAELSGTDMVFKYSGTSKVKIASDGSVLATDDVTAFGSI